MYKSRRVSKGKEKTIGQKAPPPKKKIDNQDFARGFEDAAVGPRGRVRRLVVMVTLAEVGVISQLSVHIFKAVKEKKAIK